MYWSSYNVALDIMECMMDGHDCLQICVELEGSFTCSCYPGYELQEDEVTCEGTVNKFNLPILW